jgi:hypothetical protein
MLCFDVTWSDPRHSENFQRIIKLEVNCLDTYEDYQDKQFHKEL